MVRISNLLYSVIILILIHANVMGQSDCTPQKPLVVSELKGRILFEENTAIFSVKNAEVSISEKGKDAYYGILDVKPDPDGYFEVTGLKPGKYYLTIQSMVGVIPLLEFEIRAVPPVNDNRVEFILSGLAGKCSVKTVKTFDAKPLSGSTAEREWETISEISLERTGCFGSCAIYKVTFRKDGTATYVGKDFVSKGGIFQGKVEYEFQRLAELVYRQGFFNLIGRYGAPITDLDTTIVTVVRSGKSKSVVDYGSAAPVELWGFETAIDAVADKIKWAKDKGPEKK
jgi:hypothetical protein